MQKFDFKKRTLNRYQLTTSTFETSRSFGRYCSRVIVVNIYHNNCEHNVVMVCSSDTNKLQFDS